MKVFIDAGKQIEEFINYAAEDLLNYLNVSIWIKSTKVRKETIYVF